MTIDDSALATLRATLAADDYRLDVAEHGRQLEVRISAGPDACADCLVPEPLMRSILESALSVDAERITLVYPRDGKG